MKRKAKRTCRGDPAWSPCLPGRRLSAPVNEGGHIGSPHTICMNRIVIKLGTSTLTQGGGPPDAAFIADLAAQVAAQQAQGRSVVLVSSGAIRAGMARLNLAGRPRTIPQKQAAAAVGQGRLMHTYAEAFDAHDIPVAQILLTRDDLRDRTRYLNARNTFDALLARPRRPHRQRERHGGRGGDQVRRQRHPGGVGRVSHRSRRSAAALGCRRPVRPRPDPVPRRPTHPRRGNHRQARSSIWPAASKRRSARAA